MLTIPIIYAKSTKGIDAVRVNSRVVVHAPASARGRLHAFRDGNYALVLDVKRTGGLALHMLNMHGPNDDTFKFTADDVAHIMDVQTVTPVRAVELLLEVIAERWAD